MPNTSLQILHNSGWCWFQDPRAIIHNDTLIIGGDAGNGIGDAAVGVFDLKCNQLIGRKTLHPQFDHIDHNSPVFYARDDGSLITVYARHTIEGKHYYRISDNQDYLAWGPDKTVEYSDLVTYMNLFKLKDENR